MKFCANVSILFKEVALPERCARVKEAGFSAVEFWRPSGEDLSEIEAPTKDAGLKVVLVNFDAGDIPGGDQGALEQP
jgi:hydroxypyruvate isomerase